MKKKHSPARPACLSVVVFQPQPNVFYSLDTAAHLAGVTRRSLLIYCRSGIVRPVIQPLYGMMEFTEEAIYAVRRIERLRTVYDLDMTCIKTIFDLLDEVERMRTELRFLRNP